MSKIFRKFRQQLLTENNFKQYFIYALGEIMLVVIGILIALQINTWNQRQINIEDEQKYLNRILSDIKHDIEEYDAMMSYMDLKVANNNTTLSKIRDSIAFDKAHFIQQFKSISQHEFHGRRTTYDEMISSGKMNLIRKDYLKDKIMTYYQSFDNVKRVQTINYNAANKQRDRFAHRVDINSLFQLISTSIIETDSLDLSFYNENRNSPEFTDYINATTTSALMARASKKAYQKSKTVAYSVIEAIDQYMID